MANSIWDNIQQKLECCGVKDPSDWQDNTFYRNGTVPDSCCKVETPKCGQNYRSEAIFQDGCITDMMNEVTVYFRWQIYFCTLLLVSAMIIVVFARKRQRTITPRVSFTILNKQMTQINTAERLAAKAFFGLFYKVTTNCNPTKPYNKSLINLVCSVCTVKNCPRFLSHRPRSFVARSVRKTSGNTFPYRPRTRLISP